MFRSIFFIVISLSLTLSSYAQTSIDSTFGVDGVARYYHGQAQSVTIQPDGKLLLAGAVPGGGAGLMRLLPSGAIDSAFGVNGVVNFTGPVFSGFECVLEPDGKILVSATWQDNPSAFCILCFLPDGSPDNTFGAGGKKKVYLSTGAFDHANGSGVALQPDGKIVQGGKVSINGGKFAVVRYNSNGTLDNSFGTDGKVIEAVDTMNAFSTGFALLPDGKILVSGYSYGMFLASRFAMMRFNSNGSVDNSFGVDGRVTISFGNGSEYEYSEAYGMAVQPDGKIVMAGRSQLLSNPFGPALAMARFNADGSLDASFGSGGKVFIINDAGTSYALNAVTFQPDGKIVVTGYRSLGATEQSRDFLTGRFLPDGTPDSSFCGTGFVITPLESNAWDQGDDVALQPDGKIVSAGIAVPDIAVIRFLSGLEVGVIDFEGHRHVTLFCPNPVSTSAALEYELVKNEKITIDLVDIQGKLVQTFIANQNTPAGKHTKTLHFDSNIPPGHYILRIGNGVSHQAVRIVKQ